jgi:hypothetical protein
VDVGVWGEVARGGGGVSLEEYTAGIVLAGAPLDGTIAPASYVSSTTRGVVRNSTCADALNRWGSGSRNRSCTNTTTDHDPAVPKAFLWQPIQAPTTHPTAAS